MTKQVLLQNRTYYEPAYNLQKDVFTTIRRRLSLDQQYKSSINWDLLNWWQAEGHAIRSVLEIGFGFGLTLSKFPKDVQIAGTDISLNAIRLLQQIHSAQHRQIAFCVNDSVGNLPFKCQFDMIICSHVLEHVPNDMAILHEFRRLVAPSGAVLLNVPINEQTPDPKHARQYTTEGFLEKLMAANLKVVRQITADRWSSFFSNQQYQQRPQIKLLRATLALINYPTAEHISTSLLPDFPCQQFAVLAIPA